MERTAKGRMKGQKSVGSRSFQIRERETNIPHATGAYLDDNHLQCIQWHLTKQKPANKGRCVAKTKTEKSDEQRQVRHSQPEGACARVPRVCVFMLFSYASRKDTFAL